MSWTYVQSSGVLRDPQGAPIGSGYSGNTWGLNNPAAQFQVGIGPVPCGEYTIGPPHSPADHLGPIALPLWPAATNEMHGRPGFFMHGDNRFADHTASSGCIIMPPAVRTAVNDSADRHLVVIAA